MLLELLCEARQAVISSRNEHLAPILSVPLFQQKTAGVLGRFQNPHHACLLLLLGFLNKLPQLVRHLVKFSDAFLEDRKFRNERLRHELLVLLCVHNLPVFSGLGKSLLDLSSRCRCGSSYSLLQYLFLDLVLGVGWQFHCAIIIIYYQA